MLPGGGFYRSPFENINDTSGAKVSNTRITMCILYFYDFSSPYFLHLTVQKKKKKGKLFVTVHHVRNR